MTPRRRMTAVAAADVAVRLSEKGGEGLARARTDRATQEEDHLLRIFAKPLAHERRFP
jgi:hypothetical protein